MSDKPAAYKPAFAMDKLKEKKLAEAESAEVPLTQPSKVVDDDDVEMDEVPGSEPDDSEAEEQEQKPKAKEEEKKDKKAPSKPKEDSEKQKEEEDKPKPKKEEKVAKPKAKEDEDGEEDKPKPKKEEEKKPQPKSKPKKSNDSDEEEEEEEKVKKPKPVAAPKAKKVLFKDKEEKKEVKEVKKPKESKKRKKTAGEVELELPNLSHEHKIMLSTLSILGTEDQKRVVQEFMDKGLDAEELLNESLKGLIHDAYANQLQVSQQFLRFQRVLNYFNVKLTGPNIKFQNLSCTPKSAPRKPLLQRVFCEGGKTKEEFKEFMAKVKAKDEKALARHKKLVAQQEALHKEMIAKAAKETSKDSESASVTVDAKLFHNYRIVNCEGNEDLPETTVEVAKSNKKASKQSKPRAASKKAAKKKPVEEEDEALESDWSDEDEAEEEELGDDGDETEEDVKPKDKKAKHK